MRRPLHLSRRGLSTSSFNTRPLRFEPLEDRRLLAITVNTLVDELDGSILDGDISLRDAIAASPAGGEIDFSVTGTIGLSLGQLTINKSLTITGPGADLLTIDQNTVGSRVFNIHDGGPAPDKTVSISGLTITGGNLSGFQEYGAGIFKAENLTLTNCTVLGNSTNSLGGGIFSPFGLMTIIGSTISGNSARDDGGGIFSSSGTNLTITGSTISGNSSLFGFGGGIFCNQNSLTITGSTISGNSSTGVSGNRGGGIYIYANPISTITSSIITGNSAAQGSEIFDNGLYGTRANINGFNLIGDSSKTTAQALAGVTAGPNTILATSSGTNPTALAAILAPLADNGGPTQTHALVAGSLAINAGNPGFTPPPDFDQRGAGYQRVVNGRVDIGAYEVQSLDMIVDTLADESDGDYSVGDLSLREAIQLANGFVGADTISFAGALAGGTINIASQLPTITGAVTITGPGANLLTIDAGNGADHLPATLDGFRIFHLNDNSAALIDVGISGLTLTGGDTSGEGGAILNQENLTLTESAISGNAATGGGGVFSYVAPMTIIGTTLSGNSATVRGGGIFNFYGLTTLTNSTLSGNSANGAAGVGGGIANIGGTMALTSSTLSSNVALIGGGIYSSNGTVTITGSLITGNSAPLGREIGNNVGTVNLNGFNLIGDSSKTTAQALAGVAAGATDILATSNGTNPTALAAIIAPLADNGGPTKTHALVAGSPARDAGNPSFTPPPDFDQRGAGYERVVNGRIDIGAYEVQAPSADFDGDGDVDGRDFLAWQRGFGTPTPTAFKSQGDADNDLDVDGGDLGVWQGQYGTVPGPLLATLKTEGSELSVEVRLDEGADPGSAIPGLGLVMFERDDIDVDSIVYQELNVEEVDRAIEQFAIVPSGARSFGEMVARRKDLSRRR